MYVLSVVHQLQEIFERNPNFDVFTDTRNARHVYGAVGWNCHVYSNLDCL